MKRIICYILIAAMLSLFPTAGFAETEDWENEKMEFDQNLTDTDSSNKNNNSQNQNQSQQGGYFENEDMYFGGGQDSEEIREAIVRVRDEAYTQENGTWTGSSLPDDEGNATMVSSSAGGASCQWRPTLSDGEYTVYVFKIFHANSAKQTKFEIFYNGGMEEVTLNYAEGTSEWVELGTYPFAAGKTGYVRMSGSGGYLRSGPMKFVKATDDAKAPVSVFEDTLVSKYMEDIEFLASIRVSDVTSGTYRPDDNITPDEFKKMLTNCVGEDLVKKIMKEGETTSEEALTYNQAIRAAVRMVGYDVYAENKGGYPSGYLLTADRLDMLDGIARNVNEPLTRAEAAKLLRNTLLVELLDIYAVSGEDAEFRPVTGETILSKYMDINIIKGRVNANYFTTLTGGSSLDKGNVQIGDITYYSGKTNAEDYLGQKITAYVKGASGEKKTLLFIEREAYDKDVIIVESEDVSDTTTVNTFKYFQNNRLQSENISGAKIIYNGKALIDYLAIDLKPSYGDVTLLDSNSDGKFDVVFVNSYKNLVVEDVDTYGGQVYFKFETDPVYKSIIFDEENTTAKVSFKNTDGTEVEYDDIKPWNVISVAMSKDKSIIKAIRSKKKTIGQITQIGEESILISDKEYEIAQTMKDNPLYGKLTLGNMAAFYIDFKGKVAALDYSKSALIKYGYFVDMALKRTVSKTVQIKLFTQDEEWRIYDLAEKIRFNGEMKKSTDVNTSTLLKPSGTPKEQLVSYRVNDEGKVDLLNVAGAASLKEPEEIYQLTLNEELAGVKVMGDTQTKLLASRWAADGDTKIFLLPADKTKEEYYRVVDVMTLYDKFELSDIKLYDASEERFIAAMTASADNLDYLKSSSAVGVVTRVKHGRNDAGDDVIKIQLLMNGAQVEVMSSATFDAASFAETALSDPSKDDAASGGALPAALPLEKLKKGDIVQYDAKENGELIAMRVFYRADSPLYGEHNLTVQDNFTKDNAYSTIYYSVGEFVRNTDSTVTIKTKTSNDPSGEFIRMFVYSSGTKVVRHDTQTDTFEIMKVEDLAPGDCVFTCVPMGIANMMLVRK